jgi:hypothetical protein
MGVCYTGCCSDSSCSSWQACSSWSVEQQCWQLPGLHREAAAQQAIGAAAHQGFGWNGIIMRLPAELYCAVNLTLYSCCASTAQSSSQARDSWQRISHDALPRQLSSWWYVFAVGLLLRCAPR